MSNELLDTLIKLASLGTSGICIFAIFWIGWLIMNPPQQSDPDRHKTLRFYMVTCIVIALISAGAGIANAMINSSHLKEKDEKIGQLQGEQKKLEAAVASYQLKESKTKDAAKALELVLASKEAINLKNPSSEISSHIRLLHGFLNQMNTASASPGSDINPSTTNPPRE